MREPDGYVMVKTAWAQALAEQQKEFPDMHPAPGWEALGASMRDAIGRTFFAGGESAMSRFMEKWRENTGTRQH